MLIEDENITKGNIYLDWTPVGDKFTLEEICGATSMFSYGDILGDETELTEIEFADGSTTLRIIIPFKDGTKTELKAGKGIQSNFADGDKIKVNLIYGQELHKIGQKSIVRYDVWESEEQKNEYLRKREGEDLSTEVTEDDFTYVLTDEFGVKYSSDKSRLLKAPNNLQNYHIRNGTIVICDNAFSQCTELQSVIIPDSVTAIGDFAFYKCGRLSSANIPKTVAHLGICVFEGCERLPLYHPFE